MRIPITPVEVDGVTCVVGDASLAVSSNVALRVVPVDADGELHPNATATLVGAGNAPHVAELYDAVTALVAAVFEED